MAVDTTQLDAAFDKWLSERRTDLSLRQQFWLAFEAGAHYALGKFQAAIDEQPRMETRSSLVPAAHCQTCQVPLPNHRSGCTAANR